MIRKTRMPWLYKDNPNFRMENKLLSERTYAEAISRLIVVANDALIVNRRRRSIFLAKRISRPMEGFWVIGGRRFAGEDAIRSMRRCFKKETSLDIEDVRFKFLTIVEFVWSERAQEPHNVGCHYVSYIFSVELNEKEREVVSENLDPREYDIDIRLKEFTYDELLNNGGIHDAILTYYNLMFG